MKAYYLTDEEARAIKSALMAAVEESAVLLEWPEFVRADPARAEELLELMKASTEALPKFAGI